MKQTRKALTRILIILLLYFITQLLVTIVFAAIGGMNANGDIMGAMQSYLEANSLLISLVHNVLVIICLLLYRRRPARRDEFPFGPIPAKELAFCAVLGITSAVTLSLLINLLPIPEALMSSYLSSVGTAASGSTLMILLTVVIVAPIAEELLYRGAIYGTLKKASRPIAAVAVSAAIFGLMHQDPLWMIYTFIVGLALTLVLNVYDTLYAAILMHVAFNFSGAYFSSLIPEEFPMFGYVIITAVCACIAAYCIRHMAKFRAARKAEEN